MSEAFGQAKLVRNRISNLAGGQVFRVLTAQLLLGIRGARFRLCENEISRKLVRDGVVLLENWLEPGTFSEVLAEIERAEQNELSKTTPAL